MKPLLLQKAGRSVRFASILAVTAGALLFLGASRAQENQPSPPKPQPVMQTFFLKNATSVNDLNDVQTDLRNVLSRARIYGVSTENAITVSGTPEDLVTAQKLIAELDQPKKTYRVTYTITDISDGKRTGSHELSLVVEVGSKTVLKQGTRIPILTGSTGSGSDVNTQFQYVDVGMNVEVTAYEAGLHTKIEESNISAEKSNVGIQDPVIGQTMLEGAFPLITAKPAILGTVDVPGTTHQQQISVRSELLPTE